MNAREIAMLRMCNLHLWGPPLHSLEDVVGCLGALQAQEYSLAKWSVAQRAEGVTDSAMQRAVAEGVVLRTHILRPTWHFVLPADIGWMLDLTAPRVQALSAYYCRRLELDDDVFARSNAVLAGALAGGEHLTRKELATVLQGAGIEADGLRLGYLLMRAELDAVVCSGAPRGKQQTYASFELRVPAVDPRDRDAALAELTARYFTARGPATLRDFMWWSSLTAADARNGLDMVRSRLEKEEVDGRTYWFGSPPSLPGGDSKVDLVQGYDECIVSYTESKDLLYRASVDVGRIRDRTVFTHAVLLEGRLIGHWRPVRSGKAVAVETYFYEGVDRIEAEALDAAVDALGQFLEVPIKLA